MQVTARTDYTITLSITESFRSLNFGISVHITNGVLYNHPFLQPKQWSFW